MFKPNPDELHAAMVKALADQQNEELALVKAQLAVEKDKTAQLERQVTRLKVELKGAETATQFVKAFTAIIQPILPESKEVTNGHPTSVSGLMSTLKRP